MLMSKQLKWPLGANDCGIFLPHSSLLTPPNICHGQIFLILFFSCFHLFVFPPCPNPLCYTSSGLFTTDFCFFELILGLPGFVRPVELISHLSFALFSNQRLSSAENRNLCAKHGAFSGCTWVQPSPCLWHQHDLITWLSLIWPGFFWAQVKSRIFSVICCGSPLVRNMSEMKDRNRHARLFWLHDHKQF